jgi:phage-related protein
MERRIKTYQKKSQKAPKGEIEKALTIKNKYYADKGTRE